MNHEQYSKLTAENPNVGLVRPFWDESEYHRKIWIDKDVTVLICQRKTKELIQLCLESLLQYYPDIPVIVVDGDSQDDSTLYLRYKSIVCPNLKVWERTGINSHGITMDEAIRNFVNTNYVLLMDSDVITFRSGYIEGMMEQFIGNINLYATGNLMLVSRQNEACGAPFDENDVLRYTHPCCSIYQVPTYKKMRPFANHGAPCVFNLLDAEIMKYDIGYFPVDKYTAHLSGASWQDIPAIWCHDYDVKLRPFITFVVTNPVQADQLSFQDDKDFDMVTIGNHIIDDVVIHGNSPSHIDNYTFDLRFKVQGEYVCFLPADTVRIDKVIVHNIKMEVINNKAPKELTVGGLRIVKRQIWQLKDALL
jgi:glycosyltransferase involved in cell wall biosynthesis